MLDESRRQETRAPCQLYATRGIESPCPGVECAFLRVPGLDGCAVEHWAPDVQDHEALAAWFLTRRLEADAARRERDARFGPAPPAAH